MNLEAVTADDRLDEQQVVRLFRRAADIDAERSARASIDDLRGIARELGISNESFDLALREVQSGKSAGSLDPETDEAHPWSKLRERFRHTIHDLRSKIRTAGIAATAFVLGVIGPVTNPGELLRVGGRHLWVHDVPGVITVVAMGLATLLAIANVTHHARVRTPLHFQLDNLLLWGMYAQGLIVGHGWFQGDLAAPAFMLWFGFSAVGIWFTLRPRRRAGEMQMVWRVPASKREVVGMPGKPGTD